MKRRLDIGDDRGATLVLVLVLVTVLALGLAALLSFSDTSIRTTLAMRDQTATTYNADGALQAAVNTVRNSSYNGTGNCFQAAGGNTLTLPNYAGADSAAVTCTPDPKRVLIQCPSLSNCNRPGDAILTLGQVAGEDGLNVQQPTGSTLRVHGNIFSNSNIDVVNGALNTNTRVYARTSCTGTIQSTPAPSCNYGTTPNPLGNDPGYTPSSASAPGYQSMDPQTAGTPWAQCKTKGPNSVIVFQPGYYDDAKSLSDMMAGNSPCRHSTWWFKPGNYYFDFHNSGTGADPVLGAAANLWTVDDGYLVAGTPVNAAGSVIASPPVPATIPGSCDNPINDSNAVGVQFIFGNDSQLAVKAGQAEICGTYAVAKPPVAVYGLTSGAETTTALTGANVLKLNGSQPAGDFVNPANAQNPDTNYAVWTPTGNGNGTRTGTLNLTGFAPPSVVPPGSNLGSTVNSTALLVRHLNAAGSSTDTRTVTITPKSAGGATGSPIALTLPSYNDNQWHTDQLDLSGNSPLAQFVHQNGFSGAAITYTAGLKHNDPESVDAIQLNLTYTAPAYRANAGCVTTGPYTGVGSASTCAMVSSINNSGGLFYIQGTTYAPRAAVDLTLNNAAEQVIRFGVVARTLWVKLTGSFSYNGVVIEVPDDSPGFVFSVYLTAYVCPRSSTCSPSTGTARLRSRVAYVDADPVTPTPGQRQVTVMSWTNLN